MKLGYLLNTYPITNTTFIRREIEALEMAGQPVVRFAVRTWNYPLVDERDVAEQRQTRYLLTGNYAGLLLAFLRELLTNPFGILRALGAWFRLVRNSGRIIRPAAYFLEAISLRQRTASEGVGHLHIHFATNATAVAMLSRLMGGPTYSFTAHGPDEFVEPEKISFREKIAHASFVVAISEYSRKRLQEIGRREDAGKVHVARCGLALENFADEPLPIGPDQTLVCVGRLCPQKSQTMIPAAVAALRAEFPKLKVVLLGDGISRPEVEAQIARHGVADMVELRGWATSTQVRETLRESRGLLLPSLMEGLPIVIMESLCLGRPVISTRIAGIPELVDDSCGWLVEPGNLQQLIEAMRLSLAKSPAELSAMGLAGHERVMRSHDRRDLAKNLMRLFDKVAVNPRGEVALQRRTTTQVAPPL